MKQRRYPLTTWNVKNRKVNISYSVLFISSVSSHSVLIFFLFNKYFSWKISFFYSKQSTTEISEQTTLIFRDANRCATVGRLSQLISNSILIYRQIFLKINIRASTSVRESPLLLLLRESFLKLFFIFLWSFAVFLLANKFRIKIGFPSNTVNVPRDW